jgi:ribonuclease P protein component
MTGAALRSADFERMLASPACSRSAHFAAHYVRSRPGEQKAAGLKPEPSELSTDRSPSEGEAVDDCVAGHWLGCVIPKRHARRAVTRNLLRRQMRAAMQRHQARLRPGLWLLRLRQPFAPAAFASAASTALRRAAASELDRLLARAAV